MTLGDDTYNFNYTITLVNGQGVLSVTSGNDETDGDSGSIGGYGQVTMIPTNGDCTLAPMFDFDVAYSFVLTVGS